MKEIAAIGMSPGNGYFKEEVVQKLIKKVVDKFGKTIVLIPDVPAISTYIALGYPLNIAQRKKAIPNGKNLKNKVSRTKEMYGYSDEQVRIIDWQGEVEENQSYKEKYKSIIELYNSNNEFKAAVNDATRRVLEYSDREIEDIESALKTATHYLLSEFAFMEFMIGYLNVDKITYIYHRNWPVYEKYIKGEFDGVSKAYLGFEIVTT